MPKEREIEKRIEALYKRKTIEVYMFGYVSGILDTIQTARINQAVKIFLDKHKIWEDDWCLENAIQVYYRLRDDIDSLIKNENK